MAAPEMEVWRRGKDVHYTRPGKQTKRQGQDHFALHCGGLGLSDRSGKPFTEPVYLPPRHRPVPLGSRHLLYPLQWVVAVLSAPDVSRCAP